MRCKAFEESLNLEKTSKSGGFGWLVLAISIMVYEFYAIKSKKIETLTKFFWRTTEKQIIENIFTGVWLGLTFHLLIEKSLRKQIQIRKGIV